jgi:molecular chaperone GrpE
VTGVSSDGQSDSGAVPAGEVDPAGRGPGSAGPGPQTDQAQPAGDPPGLTEEDLLEVIAADPLAALAVERDEYRDALVRLQADFENYKKRVRNQQAELSDRAAETLVDKLLPVLDTADLALAHGSGEEVKQVTDALYSALEREGLERIDPAGSSFDPTLHDAVAHEPGEVEGGGQEVAEVLRAGYRWKGRVLRPAMVKVRG